VKVNVLDPSKLYNFRRNKCLFCEMGSYFDVMSLMFCVLKNEMHLYGKAII